MLHKWIIDVYLQTPHRGIKDTPAHRWHTDLSALPPPLPPSASELEVALGMTAQRVVFHYGIELEGLKYNGPELGELRRRMGVGAKIELTFDPGDLGHVNVLDPEKGVYIIVPAVNQAYARGLSFWQNKVIRRYAQRQLNARTDIVALAQAKAEIRALVERDFNRKSTRGRKRHARFMADHTAGTTSDVVSAEIVGDSAANRRETQPHPADNIEEHPKPPAGVDPAVERPSARCDAFGDDEILPIFEADLDLPHLSAAAISIAAKEEIQ
jgi:putative transposase